MFWRENTVYPFAHYVVPLAVYLASRHLFFSLFLMYAWESLETLLAEVANIGMFKEPYYDRMIGDPLHGGIAIGTAYLADVVFCWHDDVVLVHWAWRLTFFVVIFAAQLVLILPKRRSVGIFFYGIVYVASMFLILYDDDDAASIILAAASIVVGLQTLVVMWPFNDDGKVSDQLQTRFSRSFITSMITLIIVGIIGASYRC